MSSNNVIPGFAKLTKQELFDMSARHILSTGKQSTRCGEPDAVCIYGGSGCGAAPFLKPEVRQEMDSKLATWDELAKLGFVPEHEVSFIRELQLCHDSYRADSLGRSGFMSDWKIRMKRLARIIGLSTAVFDVPDHKEVIS